MISEEAKAVASSNHDGIASQAAGTEFSERVWGAAGGGQVAGWDNGELRTVRIQQFLLKNKT